LWLHGGLISDTYSGTVFGNLLPTLAKIVLYGILWFAPLLTLTFLQAVVMPVHSEWLSGAVRLSLVLSVLLVIYSAMHGKRSVQRTTPLWKRMRVGMSIALLLCASALFLSLHVFLWPGEILQQMQTAISPKAWVWNPQRDDPSAYRYFFKLNCGSKLTDPSSWGDWSGGTTNSGDYGEVSWYKRKPFDP
jgi:hypothetical protein